MSLWMLLVQMSMSIPHWPLYQYNHKSTLVHCKLQYDQTVQSEESEDHFIYADLFKIFVMIALVITEFEICQLCVLCQCLFHYIA